MNYKIADTVFSLRSPHPLRLRGYGTELPAEMQIVVTEADALAERARMDAPISDEAAEFLALQRKLCDAVLEKGILLFHGSAVAVDGEVYIFAAPSGTGKSTHARLWRELLGKRAVMVNDDKPFIRVGEPCVVYGSPWDGKHHLSSNLALPLKAICLLERDVTNHIERLSPSEALSRLLMQAYREEAVEKILPLVLRLAEAVSLYHLGCNMEPEAAQVSWRGMNPGDDGERDAQL